MIIVNLVFLDYLFFNTQDEEVLPIRPSVFLLYKSLFGGWPAPKRSMVRNFDDGRV